MIKIDLWVNRYFTVKLLINTSITRKLDFKEDRHHKEKMKIHGGGVKGTCYTQMNFISMY